MNSDRYIPSRINWDIDAANFWVKNHTVKEKYHDYLLSTRLPEQDINYPKRLRYDKELTKRLGIRSDGRVLPYNIAIKRSLISEEWPVRARAKPVNKPRLAALDLPNIRTDICCNVLNWSSSNHIIAALGKITYMWHVPSSTMTKSIKCSYDITALQMNKDSTILAFAGEELSECEIKFWYVKQSNILQVTDPVECHHKNCYVTCIEYHPSNKYLILGCRKGYIVVKTADMISVSVAKNAHSSLDVIKIKCSPDGKYVATSGFDGFVQVWNFPHLELVCSHREPFCSKGISWHPWKCSYLCIGTTNGNLTLINVHTGKVIANERDYKSLIYDVTFNKLSAELVTSQSVCQRSNSSVLTFHSQINVLSSLHRVVDRFEGHCRKVLFLEWSPDSRILASAGSDETIHLWKFFEDNVESPRKPNKPASILNLEQFIR